MIRSCTKLQITAWIRSCKKGKMKCRIKAIMAVSICTEKQKETTILLIYAKIK